MWAIVSVSVIMTSVVYGGECVSCATEVVDAVNDYRVSKGLGALKVNVDMAEGAVGWSRQMAESGKKIHSSLPWAENIASAYVLQSRLQ